ncbi:MAG: DUF2271 domain-containing protein [Alphaproteobacteria bacterium]|nr:DUF2271 domain-containing protein [Alphaproteobacteria bacterium]
MRIILSAALGSLLAGPALAASIKAEVEIPRLSVAEYHKPYVGMWIERADHSVAANLAVWYDTDMRDDEGVKWLKDLRQWWRRIGRATEVPIDGVSGATRPPGTHDVSFEIGAKAISALPPGDYTFVIEAARELGGRELIRVPFQWPQRAKQSMNARGEHELGRVTVTIEP